MARKIRMGMVGGGRDAFIGSVHRMASRLDGMIDLVCGAFSSDPAKSKASGADLFLPADRCYGSYQEMFQTERALPPEARMDFVAIVTPNFLHHPVAMAALEAGFHVMCDKPVTLDLAEARQLEDAVRKTGLLFGLTHNYTGYPMVKEARDLVRSGKLGRIRKVVAEYPQGWLGTALEQSGQKQASWRTDPKRAGASCCMGDIGTHAENLAEYITGLEIEQLCADLTTFIPGRLLDDDGNVLLRFKGGARGVLYASQVSSGEENALAIRVYGERGGIEWRQMEPNTLVVKWADRPAELYRTGGNYGHLSRAALHASRLPGGHPEAFIEAFANLYRNFALTLQARLDGRKPEPEWDFPTIRDGVRGMAFLDAVVRSSASREKWFSLEAG
jgi:predicted dehydrogenase